MANETSYRLHVLKKLSQHLEGTVLLDATGAPVGDLTGKVFRGRAIFGDSMALPMLSILESVRPGVPTYADLENKVARSTWDILLQGWVDDDINNPTDPAYELMAHVESRLSELLMDINPGTGMARNKSTALLGPHPTGNGSLIASLEYGPGVVRPPTEQVSSKAFFYLPLRLGLATNAGQPYISS